MIKKFFAAFIFALIVATVALSPTAASATDNDQYIIAIWKNKAGDPKFPQYLVDSYATSDPNPNILTGYAKDCGTFYQSDTYANDERTAKLIAGKVLRGGDESWPLDSKGNQIQRYATLTTDPCPVVVTPPPVVTPTPVPPVIAPEVPSSPDTPTPTTGPTSPTPNPTSPTIPADSSTGPALETGPITRPSAPVTPGPGSSGAPSQRIAPVPTPIRTEAKFTG